MRETIAVACERAVRVRNPVAAALHLPAVARSEAAVRTRVDELVDRLRLGPYADRFGHELSTGTRRIVDLACVLAHEPTVLLLDDPASGVAQRDAEALGPLLAELRDGLDAAVLVWSTTSGCWATSPTASWPSTRAVSSPTGARRAVLTDPAVMTAYLGA